MELKASTLHNQGDLVSVTMIGLISFLCQSKQNDIDISKVVSYQILNRAACTNFLCHVSHNTNDSMSLLYQVFDVSHGHLHDHHPQSISFNLFL